MSTVPSSRFEGARTASVLNAIAGVWLIISSWVLGFAAHPAALWSTLIVGIVVLVFAWIRAARPGMNVGLSWLNLILGIWLIIAPAVCRFSMFRVAAGNSIVLGIIVGILGLISALATAPPRRMAP
jgi:hypothetical protein